MTTKQEALKALRIIQNEKWDNRIEAMERYKTACDRLSIFINSFPEWRPIEEAPRDGTFVLVLLGNGEHFRASFDGGWWVATDFPFVNPSYFMPLPQPPKETQ